MAGVVAVARPALPGVVAVFRDHGLVVEADADVVAGHRVRDAPAIAASPLATIPPAVAPVSVIFFEVKELFGESAVVPDRLTELSEWRQGNSAGRRFILNV